MIALGRRGRPGCGRPGACRRDLGRSVPGCTRLVGALSSASGVSGMARVSALGRDTGVPPPRPTSVAASLAGDRLRDALLHCSGRLLRSVRRGRPAQAPREGRSGRPAEPRDGGGTAAEPSEQMHRGGPEATGARIRAGDEEEVGREGNRRALAGDPNDAFLQRLAQRIEDQRRELAQLIQEQHPPMGQGDFARARAGRSSADEGGGRGGVMGSPEGSAPNRRPGPPARRRSGSASPRETRRHRAEGGSTEGSGPAASCRRPAARP